MSNLLLFFLMPINIAVCYNEKVDFCSSMTCENSNVSVCGVREEGDGVRLRLFQDECELLKFGCKVEDDQAYGLINLEYCDETFSLKRPEKTGCLQDCDDDLKPVCGMRQDGTGVRIKHFESKCDMLKYNCEKNVHFSETDGYICNGSSTNNNIKANETKKLNNTLIVVDASLFYNGNINNTIDNFFAATHLVGIPLQEVDQSVMNDKTRRRLVTNAGPAVIYKPWIKIPENISDDVYHRPTLASCYHKCPTECPNTYAPVCGVPGMKAREPSLMFQNHCFMDVAQCKMHYENIGPTAVSSAYIESPFIFCMGEQLSRMYVLLPLVRTLQHMGRLRKKGHFHHWLRNMRHDNIAGNKVMG